MKSGKTVTLSSVAVCTHARQKLCSQYKQAVYTREAKAVLPIQASCVHSRGKSCAPNTSKLCTLTREKLCFQYKQAVYTHEGKAVLPILLQYTNQGRATTGLCLLHVRPSSRHSSQLLACIHTCFCCLANKC